ncbi:MAG: serine/threonine-protein kinase [Pirellulales bacterium]
MNEREIFIACVQSGDPRQRAEVLDERCSDPVLRARVEYLLQAYDSAGSFLQDPPSMMGQTLDSHHAAPTRTTVSDLHVEETPGRRIGPYELVEVLGEGGMGTVWSARQEVPLRRAVALKLIKAGMDSRQVVARFEAERQALAVMDHPHIARVLDAGATATGRPYFVMELVRGVPITHFANEHQLTIDQRVALLIPVCEAIQHAHHKGVLHRDIKPSNVLVATFDGRPVSKVIDFGVAKAIGQPLAEPAPMTALGGIVGTFEYMAPEQAEFDAQDIDTRADVYSLGVLLYELLTGTTPLDRSRRSIPTVLELLRMIREEDTPAPSVRLGEARAVLPNMARQRQIDPSRLVRAVRGELDWIALRALEKDRRRRYQTPQELALDLQRYLAGEPVQAGPPSFSYRARKFVARHRGAVTAVIGLIALLVIGLMASTYSALVANQARAAAVVARQEADAKRADLEKLTAFQQRQLSSIDVRAMGARLRDSIVDQAQLHAVGEETSAERDARVARLAMSLESVNFTDVALTSIRENILDRALVDIERNYADQPLLQASLRETIAGTLWDLGLHDAAVTPQTQALDTRRRWLGAEHPLTLASMTKLGTILQAQGKLVEAEPVVREALALQRQRLGVEHAETLHTMQELGWNLGQQGRQAEALTLLSETLAIRRRLLGVENGLTLTVMGYTADVALAMGDQEQAESLYREAAETARRRYGDDAELTLSATVGLSSLLMAQKRYDEAEPLLRAAADGYRRVKGDRYIHTLTAVGNLAGVLREQGKLDEAELLMRETLEGRRASLGNEHPHTQLSRLGLARLLVERGPDRYEDAESLLLEAAPTLEQLDSRGTRHASARREVFATLSQLYAKWGKPDQAAVWRQRLAESEPRSLPSTSSESERP